MAVDLTLKSVSITNRDAAPAVPSNPGAGGEGALREVSGYLASVTNLLSVGSIIRMVEVPSNAIMSDLRFASAAQAAGAFDIGVYKNTRDGGAVIDADAFATGVVVTNAVVLTSVLNESTTFTLAKQQQPLWQALVGTPYTSDPNTTFDIALTVSTNVTTGAAAVELKAAYVQ